MKNNMTKEQKAIFDRYFFTDNGQHTAMNSKRNFHVAFFDFEVYRETDVVLEIKVQSTCISMWKNVEHLHITIL